MATYGWGTNEPIIAPEAEGGENIGTVCVKIKSAIADTFTKLNSETWADASTTASGYMSASDKIKLNGIETGAEVNQFAFSNISVGGTTISADTKQDTLTLTAGTGITLTPDAGNDKVTISFDDGANVNIGGSSASCTGNAASATKLATGRTFRTNLASTSTASFDGTANVTPGVTGILPVANGGTGNSTSASKFLEVRTDDWRSHDKYFGLYKYENNGTALPAPYCIVFSAKHNAKRGAAIAIDWSGGGSGIWYTGLHDNWGSWKGLAPQPTTSAGVGQIGHLAYSPASVMLPSGGSYYYIFQADHDGQITRFEGGIASGGTQIAVNDGYSNNLRLIYIRIA